MDRREFIKTAAGTFFVASAGKVFGEGAASNRVRMAVIGCRKGGRGDTLIQRILTVPGAEVACVCDVDSRAREYAAELVFKSTGLKPVQEKDFRKVLAMKDVDAVVSATPDHFHAWSAIMAMRAGKHVYVEKPCAFCPREGEIILDTWKQTGKVFQMGSQRRSNPFNAEAIAAIRSGNLIGNLRWGKTWYHTMRNPIGKGKPVAVPEWLDWDLWQGPAPRETFRDNLVHYNWHWFRNWGTGECGNNAVHFIDLARWFMGIEEYPVRTTCGGGKFWIPDDTDWEWPDTMNVSYEYADGKMITWEGASHSNALPYLGYSTGTLMIGDSGSALITPGGDIEIYDQRKKLIKAWGAKAKVKQTDTNDRSGGSWSDSTRDHMLNFVAAIRANDPKLAAANAEIGVKSNYLALAGNIAYLTGGTLRADARTGRPLPGNSAAEKLWSRAYQSGWEL